MNPFSPVCIFSFSQLYASWNSLSSFDDNLAKYVIVWKCMYDFIGYLPNSDSMEIVWRYLMWILKLREGF